MPRSACGDLWLVLHMEMQRPSPMGLHLQQLGSLCTATPRVAPPTWLFTLHLPYHQVEQHRQAWAGHCRSLGYISSKLTLNGTLYSRELGCECTKQASCFPFCLKDGLSFKVVHHHLHHIPLHTLDFLPGSSLPCSPEDLFPDSLTICLLLVSPDSLLSVFVSPSNGNTRQLWADGEGLSFPPTYCLWGTQGPDFGAHLKIPA